IGLAILGSRMHPDLPLKSSGSQVGVGLRHSFKCILLTPYPLRATLANRGAPTPHAPAQTGGVWRLLKHFSENNIPSCSTPAATNSTRKTRMMRNRTDRVGSVPSFSYKLNIVAVTPEPCATGRRLNPAINLAERSRSPNVTSGTVPRQLRHTTLSRRERARGP